jgi:hypothetical protein
MKSMSNTTAWRFWAILLRNTGEQHMRLHGTYSSPIEAHMALQDVERNHNFGLGHHDVTEGELYEITEGREPKVRASLSLFTAKGAK